MTPPPLSATDALPSPTARQLALPWPTTAGSPTPPPAPEERAIPPRQVWAGLPPSTRQALRRAVLRVLEEVRHAADRA